LSDEDYDKMRSRCKAELTKNHPFLEKLADEYRSFFEKTVRPLDNDAGWKAVIEWVGSKELEYGDIRITKLPDAPSRPPRVPLSLAISRLQPNLILQQRFATRETLYLRAFP